MHLPSKDITRAAVLFLAVAIAYLPVLTAPAPVNPDAQFILSNLREAGDVTSYLSRLFSFTTIDIQPVRDVSLSLDLLIQKLTGLHTMVLQNVILWIVSVFLLMRILRQEFGEKFADEDVFLICLVFALYPLFSQSLSWGMARKHILALLFSLAATYQHLRKRRGFTLFYTLAVLSQPIAILLPLWALARRYSANKKFDLALLPSIFIMGILGIINFLYYRSPFFLSLFGQKTEEAFSFPDKVLAVGHYGFQLVFPYFLSLYYTLGHWQVLAGLALFAGILIFLLRVKSRDANLWMLYASLPLSVVLVKATTLYDTYLLLPATGILLLLLTQIRTLRKKFLIVAAIAFLGVTAYQTVSWRDEVKLMEASFRNRPDCLTAVHYLRMSYENGLRPSSPEARNMLRSQDCGKIQVSPQYLSFVEASFLFYEDEFPLERRYQRLRELQRFGVFPHLALIALLIEKQEDPGARAEIDLLLSRWKGHRFKPEYIPLVHGTIAPFCRKNELPECTEFIQPFLPKN